MTKFKRRRQEAELRKKYGISTNRRAGLRPKKSEKPFLAKKPGLKRIKKRRVDVTRRGLKPCNVQALPYKHKRRLIKVLAVVAVVAIAAVAVLAMGFWKKDASILRDLGFDTIRIEYPKDGTTPANFLSNSGDKEKDKEAALFNVAYMHDRFKTQPFWESYYHGVVSTVATQDVQTWKHYEDGVLVSADITTSSLIKNARQFCVANGRVLWRNAADYRNANTYDGMNTPWSSSLQGNLPIESTVDPVTGQSNNDGYKVKRGLPHDAFCVYVINADTLLDASEVTVNADGTYTQTYILNPVTYPSSSEYDELQKQSAAYYYKQQMKVTGDLDELPTFHGIEVTFTFDDTWQLLRSDIKESYSAKFMVTAECTTSSYTVYNYDENSDPVDPNTGRVQSCDTNAYDEYFKERVGADASGEEELGALDYITKAFDPVINGEADLDVDVKIGTTAVKGRVYTNIPNGKAIVSLGNLFVEYGEGASFGNSSDGQTVFIKYGGIKLRLPIDQLSDIAAMFTGDNGSTAQAAAIAEDGESSGFDISSLTAGLGNAEIVKNEDGTKATIKFEILGLPIEFAVNIGANNAISLDYVALSTALEDTPIDLKLAFSDGKNSVRNMGLTNAEKQSYTSVKTMAAPLVGVKDMIGAPAFKFGVDYSSDALAVDGDIYFAYSPVIMVSGDLALDIKGVKYNLSVAYDGAEELAYVTLSGGNDADGVIKLKADVKKIAGLFSAIAGEGEDKLTEIVSSLTEKMSGVKLDIAGFAAALLSDDNFAQNIALTCGDEGVNFAIKDINQLLAALGVEIDGDLGEFSANVSTDGVSLKIFGVTLSASAAEGVPEIDKDGAAEYTDVIALAEKVNDIIAAGGFGASGKVELKGFGDDIKVTLDSLAISWSDGVRIDAAISAKFGAEEHKLALQIYGDKDTRTLDISLDKTVLTFDISDGDNDLRTLDGAVTSIYNTLKDSGLLATFLGEDKVAALPEIDTSIEEYVKGLISSFAGEGGLADMIAAVADKLPAPETELTLDGVLDALSALRVLDPEYEGGVLRVGYGDMLSIELDDDGSEENGWLSAIVGYKDGETEARAELSIKAYAQKADLDALFANLGNLKEGDGVTVLNVGTLASVISRLADSLAPVIEGKANFAAAIDFGDISVSGNITTNIPEIALYADFGNLYAELSDGEIFVNYGDNLSIKAPMNFDYLKSVIGKFTTLSSKPLDIDKLISDLANTTFTEGLGKSTAKINVLGVSLDISFNDAEKILDNITLTANAGGKDISVKLTYNKSAEGVAPLTAEQKGRAISLESIDGELDAIASFVHAKAIDFSVNIDAEKLSLSGSVKLGLSPLEVEGELVLSINGVQSKALYIAYSGADVYLALADYNNLNGDKSAKNARDSVRIKTNISEAIDIIVGLVSGEKTDVGAENDGKDGLTDFDLAKLVDAALSDGQFANGISLTKGDGLNLTVTNLVDMLKRAGIDLSKIISGGELSLTVQQNGNISASVGLGLASKSLGIEDITVTLGATASDVAPAIDGTGFTEYRDILPVIQKVSDIVKVGALTAEVNLNISIDGENGTTVSLALDRLDVSWKEGVKVNAALQLDVNGSKHTVYVQFADNKIYVVYGGLAVALDWNKYEPVEGVAQLNDLQKIDAAAVALYSRLRDHIIDTMLTDKDKNPLPAVGDSLSDEISAGLSKLIEYVKQLMTTAEAAEELSESLPADDEGFDIDGVLQLVEKLSFLEPQITDGGILRLIYDGLKIELANNSDGALALFVDYEKNGVKVQLDGARVWAFGSEDAAVAQFAGFDLSSLEVDFVTGDEIAEMLDFIGSALEITVQDKFELSLSGVNTSLEKKTVTAEDGTVTQTDEDAYTAEYTLGGKTYNNVKYVLEGNLAYDIGSGGYPLHFLFGEDEQGNTKFNDLQNFYISPTLRTSIRVQLAATEEERDSSFFLEGHVLDYGESGPDGELDVFLTISTYADWEQMSSKPTKIKGTSDNRKPLKIHAPTSELMTVVAIVAEVLDVDIDFVENLLINNWIGASRYQFAALGESLVGTLDLGALNGVIGTVNELFATLNDSDDLGGFITSLLGKFKDGGEQNSPASAISLSADKYNFSPEGFIKACEFEKVDPATGEAGEGATKTTMTFDKNSIYGGNEKAKDDIQFTATKYDTVYDEKGAISEYSRLKNVGLHNVYFNDCLEMLDLDIGVNYQNQFDFVEPVYSEYMSLQGIDVLLESLVNSATHKTGETEVDGAQVPVYDVNDSFYIDGNLAVNMELLGLDLISINVTIEGLEVTIGDDFNIGLNARLFIPKTTLIIPIVTASTYTDITLSNGVLYVRRTADSKVVYRAYSLEGLKTTANIIDFVGFALNFSDTLISEINKNLTTDSGSTSTTTDARQDLGAMLDKYIKSLSTNDRTDGYDWTMVLNGNSLMSALSDVTVTLNANADGKYSDGKDAYTIYSLSAGLSLASLVNLDAQLYLKNPKGQMIEGTTVKTTDMAAVLEAAMQGEIEVTDWTKTSYVEGELVHMYFIDKDVDDAVIVDVVINSQTRKSYSVFTIPDIEPYRKANPGYYVDWDISKLNIDSDGKLIFNGVTTVNINYRGYTYHITLVSDSEVTADGWSADEGKWKYTFDYLNGTEFKFPEVGDIRHKVTGWKLNGELVDATRIQKYLTELEDGATIELEAVWTDINYTVTYDYNDKTTTQEGVYGDELDFPTDTGKTGYEFAGWNTEDTTITGNVTYTAQYTPCKYTITVESEYEINGIAFAFDSEEYKDGKWYYTFTYEYDSFIVLPSSIIITDDSGTRHHLDGFAFDAAGAVSNNMQNVTAPTTMYAKWSVVQSLITFTSTETGVSYTQNYNDGDSLSNLPEVPARAHYTGEWDIKENYTVHGDDTIYAKYTPITYTVRAISYQSVDGYTHDESKGYWYKEYSYTYKGAEVSLDDVDIPKFDFGGYFTAPDGEGNEVAKINDALIEGGYTEIYIKWIDNGIFVTAYSDVNIPGIGLTYDMQVGAYRGTFEFHDDYKLPDVSTLVPGYQQLGGWWYTPAWSASKNSDDTFWSDKNNTWSVVNDLKEQGFNYGDEVSVWAVWIQNISVKVTDVGKTDYIFGSSRYYMSGSVTGGNVFGVTGTKIYTAIGATCTMTQTPHFFSKDGKTHDKMSNVTKTLVFDANNVAQFSLTDQNSLKFASGNAFYGGAVITAKFSYDGGNIVTTSGSLISLDTFMLTFTDDTGKTIEEKSYRLDCPYAVDGQVYATNGYSSIADLLPAAEKVAKEGYSYVWSVDVNQPLPSENLTISAVYTANLYKVRFESKEEIEGWSSAGVGADKIYFFETEMRYDSTININNGDEHWSYTVKTENIITLPAAAAGKTWNVFAVAEYAAEMRATSDVNVLNFISDIVFDYNGAKHSVIIIEDKQTVGAYAINIVPTANGYTFLGWFADLGSGYEKVESINLTEEYKVFDIHAVWVENLKVSFVNAVKDNKNYSGSVNVSVGAIKSSIDSQNVSVTYNFTSFELYVNNDANLSGKGNTIGVQTENGLVVNHNYSFSKDSKKSIVAEVILNFTITVGGHEYNYSLTEHAVHWF